MKCNFPILFVHSFAMTDQLYFCVRYAIVVEFSDLQSKYDAHFNQTCMLDTVKNSFLDMIYTFTGIHLFNIWSCKASEIIYASSSSSPMLNICIAIIEIAGKNTWGLLN